MAPRLKLLYKVLRPRPKAEDRVPVRARDRCSPAASAKQKFGQPRAFSHAGNSQRGPGVAPAEASTFSRRTFSTTIRSSTGTKTYISALSPGKSPITHARCSRNPLASVRAPPILVARESFPGWYRSGKLPNAEYSSSTNAEPAPPALLELSPDGAGGRRPVFRRVCKHPR